MKEQTTTGAARSGEGVASRNMVLTFMADRVVRTSSGERPAAQLRPGDRMLSGQDAGLSVLSVTFASDEERRGRPSLVKVVVGRQHHEIAPQSRPLAGRVSPRDGQLHLKSQLPLPGRANGSLPN